MFMAILNFTFDICLLLLIIVNHCVDILSLILLQCQLTFFPFFLLFSVDFYN